jgi:hypothetical protein
VTTAPGSAIPKRSRSLLLSSTEYAGRVAGVGYSHVEIARTDVHVCSARRGSCSRMAVAKPCQLVWPAAVMWYTPLASSSTWRSPAGARRDAANTWAVAAAIMRLHVGAPTWSSTTRISARLRASSSIVRRKLRPRRPYTQLVLKIRKAPPASCSARSPASFVRP